MEHLFCDKKQVVRNRYLICLFVFFFTSILFSQIPNGPGGVGSVNGTTSLRLWLDAGDLNGDANYSNNPVNGTAVSSWIDKSGYGYNLSQSTTAAQPTYSTGGTYKSVNFAATASNAQNLNNATAITLNPGSLFYVLNATDAGFNSNVLFDNGSLSCRFEQHNNTNIVGFTRYGVADYNSSISSIYGSYCLISYHKPSLSNDLILRVAGTTNTINIGSTAVGVPISRIGSGSSSSDKPNHNSVEIVAHNSFLNTAQQKIVENYLSAKYGSFSIPNDLYTMDNAASGNFDYDVAGIGRDDASNIHNDAQGTGIVRFLNPSSLGNGDYFIWGHNNLIAQATNTTDVPVGVAARFARVWRSSETGNVGSLDVRFDLTGLGMVTTSDLRLLIDTDNDGTFSDETPISGAISIGSNVYEFSGVASFANNRRFTLATINKTQTPLPIELLSFDAVYNTSSKQVDLTWQTATEVNNAYFTIERSLDAQNWEYLKQITGAGNSSSILSYVSNDKTPYNGLSYYRLKQTDIDGKHTYSLTKDVFIGDGESINAYPVPFEDDLTIHVGINTITVEIINSLGQVILISNTKPEDGKIIINTSSIQAGIYTLRITNSSNVVYKQILKK